MEGQDAGVARLALPDDGRLVLPRPGQVPVEAVVAGVGRAPHEPFGVRRLPVEDAVPLLEPVQLAGGLLGPEAFGVVLGPLVDLLVLGRGLEVGAGGELGRRREQAGFLEDALDGRRGRGHDGSCNGGMISG